MDRIPQQHYCEDVEIDETENESEPQMELIETADYTDDADGKRHWIRFSVESLSLMTGLSVELGGEVHPRIRESA